jgi:hypothetical protein
MRRWKRHFEGSSDILLVLSDDKTLTACIKQRIRRPDATRAPGAGRKCFFLLELIAELKRFFDTSSDEDFSVSLRLIMPR